MSQPSLMVGLLEAGKTRSAHRFRRFESASAVNQISVSTNNCDSVDNTTSGEAHGIGFFEYVFETFITSRIPSGINSKF